MRFILRILITFPLQHKSATENDLRREFEGYGTIERVRIVRDKKARSRGYAFIVYERERDMKGLIILLY
jgi:U1 small nuclear ribonucleoprotein